MAQDEVTSAQDDEEVIPTQDDEEVIPTQDDEEVDPLGLIGLGGRKVFSEPTMTSNTAVLVLAANGRRAVAEIQNIGTTTVWLGADAAVTPTHGQKLAAGANYTDERSLDAWYGYSEAGVGSLRVLEVTQ